MISVLFYLNDSGFIYTFHSIFMTHFSSFEAIFKSSFEKNVLPVSVVFRLHSGYAFSSVCAGSLLTKSAKSTFPNGDFAGTRLSQKPM